MTGGTRYTVLYTAAALVLLNVVIDRRVHTNLLDRADTLATEPGKKGKPLIGRLAGYRSLRAVGQRYRIVYRIDEPSKTVYIVAAGLRRQGSKRDVYELLTRPQAREARDS